MKIHWQSIKKKISINEILNQEFNNIFEKEKIVIKANEEINKSKNDFFEKYNEMIKIGKEICEDNINMLKCNINCFISLYSNFCKTFLDDFNKMIKNSLINGIKESHSNIFDSDLNIASKDIKVSKYKIKVIKNRYIEDNNKKLNLQYLEKIGYRIQDNKIMLKDEDIYEIVKIMYGQFQFISENNYNLAKGYIKINVKNLTWKLLAFDKKKIYLIYKNLTQ